MFMSVVGIPSATTTMSVAAAGSTSSTAARWIVGSPTATLTTVTTA